MPDVRFDVLPTDPVLHLPDNDIPDPEVTVLVPAMNEQITIERFCQWCHEGFERAGVRGEILIIDSSDDATPMIALSNGARVLRVPRRGLGKAYQDGIPHVRGQHVILGDADCTYDFRDLSGFLSALSNGEKFVMGSRFRGRMDRGAMPLHHKYFGSPLTTLLADMLLRLRLTDIHCGMRGLTRETLENLDLRSNGWEYASEMIVNAVRLNIRIAEVPISFYQDRDGRESHVKRQGWTTPFKAGWRTVEMLLVHGADFFLLPPGILMSLVGTMICLVLSFGPRTILDTTFTLNSMVQGMGLAGIGYILMSFGIFTRCFYDRSGSRTATWNRRLPFNKTMAIGISTILIGSILILRFTSDWLRNDRAVDKSLESESHLAVFGTTAILASVAMIVTMLTIQALHREVSRR